MITRRNTTINIGVIESKLAAGHSINIEDCTKAPSDLPSLAPTISAAALPLVLSSTDKGIYAISFVESNSEYFVDLLSKFVAAYPATLGSLNRSVEYVDLRYPNGFAVRMPDYKPKPIKPGAPKPAAAKPATPKPAGATTNKPAVPKPEQPKPTEKTAA